MNDNNDDTKITSIRERFKNASGVGDTGPQESDTDGIPTNEYVIEDINGNLHYAEGFLLFTSHHVAVMRDIGAGALPILVMPLDKVFAAELVEDDEVYEYSEPVED